MKLAYMHPDDLIEVNKGGRRMVGRVVEIRDGVVQFEPLCRGISYRHATAREIIAHWRKTGRRGPGPADEADTPETAAVPRVTAVPAHPDVSNSAAPTRHTRAADQCSITVTMGLE